MADCTYQNITMVRHADERSIWSISPNGEPNEFIDSEIVEYTDELSYYCNHHNKLIETLDELKAHLEEQANK